MTPAVPTYGLLGALAAFPRRLAARAAEARGARLRRGVDRATTHVVLGRGLLARPEAETAARVAAERAAGRILLGEAGFAASLAPPSAAPAAPGLSAEDLCARSGLPATAFELLRLFDAFEAPDAPFALRDLILARKYAGLMAEGAGWSAIARSVGRACRVSLPSRTLARDAAGAIVARDAAAGLAELDGQLLLDLDGPGATPDALFAEAEAAEATGRLAEAAAAYARCLALDPGDAAAAFNRANCLRELGDAAEAERGYASALKLDAGFVEAWFNLAGLTRARGRIAAARGQLARAIAADPAYADAVYNLATLEFEAGDLAAAERWWRRYLDLDATSEWADAATRGLQFVALTRQSR